MIWNRDDVSRRSPWTKTDIRRARQVELRPVLEKLGYRLQPLPNDNYRVIGLFPEVIVKAGFWTRPEDGKGGNAIDLLVHVKRLSFNEAVRLLLS